MKFVLMKWLILKSINSIIIDNIILLKEIKCLPNYRAYNLLGPKENKLFIRKVILVKLLK